MPLPRKANTVAFSQATIRWISISLLQYWSYAIWTAESIYSGVVVLELIYLIQQIMYFGDVNRRKLVVIDEAWNLMRDTQGAALFIEHGFRRFRRFNGANLMAVQRVEDFYETAAGRAALDNSSTQFLLKQQLSTINELEKRQRLPLSQEGYRLLKTVHTVEGKFSEALVLTEQGSGIGRLILNPFKKLLYSSHPEDEGTVRAYRDQGFSLSDAILQVLKDRTGKSHRS